MVWVSVLLLCFVGCFHSSSSGLGVCFTLVFRVVFHSSSSGLGVCFTLVLSPQVL